VNENGDCFVWTQEAALPTADSMWDVLGAFIVPSKDQVDSAECTSTFSSFTARYHSVVGLKELFIHITDFSKCNF